MADAALGALDKGRVVAVPGLTNKLGAFMLQAHPAPGDAAGGALHPARGLSPPAAGVRRRRLAGANEGELPMSGGIENEAIEAMLDEQRRFPPSEAFAAQANATAALYDEADADPEAFWMAQARQLRWATPFTRGLDWDVPFATWFADGTLNASVNCVDRHVEAGRGDKVAFHWVGDAEGESLTITYAELHERMLRRRTPSSRLGVDAGDRVAIYLPMIPEAVVADARLRPHRRASLGDLRRLLGRGPRRSDPRRGRPFVSPPTAASGGAAIALKPARRRGARSTAPTSTGRPRRAPHRPRRGLDRRP